MNYTLMFHTSSTGSDETAKVVIPKPLLPTDHKTKQISLCLVKMNRYITDGDTLEILTSRCGEKGEYYFRKEEFAHFASEVSVFSE